MTLLEAVRAWLTARDELNAFRSEASKDVSTWPAAKIMKLRDAEREALSLVEKLARNEDV